MISQYDAPTALQIDQQDADDLKCLLQIGVDAHNAGAFDDAAAFYRTVLRLAPNSYDALRLLGYVYSSLGCRAESISLHREAVKIRDEDPELLLFLAHSLYGIEAAEEIISYCDRAIQIKWDYVEAYFTRGAALEILNRDQDALENYGRAVAINPLYAEAHSNRGSILGRLNRNDEALASYRRAIEVKPTSAELHYNHGALLSKLRRHEEALVCYDRAIAIKPDFAEPHCNRGLALSELNRPAEAIESYDQAIALKPDFAEMYYNRGAALCRLNRQVEAVASCDSAIALRPDYPEGHTNRGLALSYLNRHVEALASYDRAIATRSDFAEALWNKSLSLLATGDYAAGWKLYEWRKKQKKPLALPDMPFPEDIELEKMSGRKVLIHCEQGLGDELQFCRYIPLLCGIASAVVFVVSQPLHRLLTQALPGAEICLRDQVPVDFDVHCPLMSLPLAFGTTLQNIPALTPYLFSDTKQSQIAAMRLGKKTRPRVGLVWNGGVDHEQPGVAEIRQRRNMDFSVIAGLNLDDVDFYSLQKGEPAESALKDDLARFWHGTNFYNLASSLNDFADTAALIDNLDLVISVDTSTAHLAAAMGKPVWILNRFDACWRWLLDRADSPWYPSVRLFRQRKPGDWEPMIAEVRVEIMKYFANQMMNAEI